MIELLKSELESVLITLNAVNGDGKNVGLLHEKISLGLKRKGQRIFETVMPELERYKKELGECKGNESEIKELNNEVVKFDVSKLSLSMIEEIESEYNYDFRIIEKIAE